MVSWTVARWLSTHTPKLLLARCQPPVWLVEVFLYSIVPRLLRFEGGPPHLGQSDESHAASTGTAVDFFATFAGPRSSNFLDGILIKGMKLAASALILFILAATQCAAVCMADLCVPAPVVSSSKLPPCHQQTPAEDRNSPASKCNLDFAAVVDDAVSGLGFALEAGWHSPVVEAAIPAPQSNSLPLSSLSMRPPGAARTPLRI